MGDQVDAFEICRSSRLKGLFQIKIKERYFEWAADDFLILFLPFLPHCDTCTRHFIFVSARRILPILREWQIYRRISPRERLELNSSYFIHNPRSKNQNLVNLLYVPMSIFLVKFENSFWTCECEPGLIFHLMQTGNELARSYLTRKIQCPFKGIHFCFKETSHAIWFLACRWFEEIQF